MVEEQPKGPRGAWGKEKGTRYTPSWHGPRHPGPSKVFLRNSGFAPRERDASHWRFRRRDVARPPRAERRLRPPCWAWTGSRAGRCGRSYCSNQGAVENTFARAWAWIGLSPLSSPRPRRAPGRRRVGRVETGHLPWVGVPGQSRAPWKVCSVPVDVSGPEVVRH